MKKVLIAIGVALALAAAVYAAGWHASGAKAKWGATNATKANWCDNSTAWHPPAAWGHGGRATAHGMPIAWGRGKIHGGLANATLYVSTRQVTISGDGISAQLTVDIVNRNTTSTAGRVIYGTGTVTLGGATYNAKTVYGVVGNNAARLTIYTGDAIISLLYKNGQYYAVVKPLGKSGYERFNGTATLQIR